MSVISFCNENTVPIKPTIPPTAKIMAARCGYPCSRNENSPGSTKAIIVPAAHPTRSRTSPREGAKIANKVVILHSKIITPRCYKSSSCFYCPSTNIRLDIPSLLLSSAPSSSSAWPSFNKGSCSETCNYRQEEQSVTHNNQLTTRKERQRKRQQHGQA
jgi:hypothetical protein